MGGSPEKGRWAKRCPRGAFWGLCHIVWCEPRGLFKSHTGGMYIAFPDFLGDSVCVWLITLCRGMPQGGSVLCDLIGVCMGSH